MRYTHVGGPGGRARLTSWMKRCRPPSERSAFTSTASVRSTPSRSQHLATHSAECSLPQQLDAWLRYDAPDAPDEASTAHFHKLNVEIMEVHKTETLIPGLGQACAV